MTDPQPAQPLAYDPAPYLYSRDVSHLNLLATFHYVGGGITLAFACIPLIHVTIGILMLSGKFAGTTAQPGPPPELGWIFVLLGGLCVMIGWSIGILIIYSGRCIKMRRHWTFSVVIAGITCLNVPIGTVLGVFTLIVLLRDSVKRLYGIDVTPVYPPPYQAAPPQ